MKLYRFSPIASELELFAAIAHIHAACYGLCMRSFGAYLPNAGNVGVFCHYDEEHHMLTKLREELTEPSDDPLRKYFLLHEPITVGARDGIPAATYTHLYIRTPDPYRHHVGDVDFYLEPGKYAALKARLEAGASMPGARVFPRADLDMVELFDPDIDALAYVSRKTMTEKVRSRTS